MTAPGTVAEIEAAGGEAMGVQADLAEPAAAQRAIDEVVEAWGRIDVLVANAGGGGAGAAAASKASVLAPDLLRDVTANNLFATVHTVTAAAPTMKAQRSGKIITVASMAAYVVSVDGSIAHYAAAKAAILQYTRYLAQDLGPFGITANCIAPGVTASGRIQEALIGAEEHAKAMAELVALRRLATVEDLARVIEFLATDLSDYVTGVLIPVDGGMRAG
jgi:3-oxoacyl-[acyl-carrier protein] reductase